MKDDNTNNMSKKKISKKDVDLGEIYEKLSKALSNPEVVKHLLVEANIDLRKTFVDSLIDDLYPNLSERDKEKQKSETLELFNNLINVEAVALSEDSENSLSSINIDEKKYQKFKDLQGGTLEKKIYAYMQNVMEGGICGTDHLTHLQFMRFLMDQFGLTAEQAQNKFMGVKEEIERQAETSKKLKRPEIFEKFMRRKFPDPDSDKLDFWRNLG